MAASNGDTSGAAPDLLATLQLAVTHGCCYGTQSFKGYATTTHKFILVQGVLYALTGLLSVLIPALVADVMLIPSPAAVDLAWFRITGVCLCVSGHFYMQGAHQLDVKPCVVVTTFGRLVLVPPLLGYCILCGSCPQICITFGILDPLLAVLTHWVWVRDTLKQR